MSERTDREFVEAVARWRKEDAPRSSASNSTALLSCPFCGGMAFVISNRDWHRLFAEHNGDCLLDDGNEVAMVAATDEGLRWLHTAWNHRAR